MRQTFANQWAADIGKAWRFNTANGANRARHRRNVVIGSETIWHSRAGCFVVRAIGGELTNYAAFYLMKEHL